MIFMSTREKLLNIFEVLLKHFGPQKWWPADSPFEVMVGAILTQNTSWSNVEKAISNLKNAKLLDPRKMLRLDAETLANLIRPAGYPNVKTKRLQNFLRFFVEEFNADVAKMGRESVDSLREKLLSVKGVGPETADSILLYAFAKPVFVCDAYTHRIFSRHGMLDDGVSYDDVRALFMGNLPNEEKLFNEYHALIVKTGKDFCRPRPKCVLCPLGALLKKPLKV